MLWIDSLNIHARNEEINSFIFTMFLKLESPEILFQRWHDAKKAVRGFTYIFNGVTELLCILSQSKDVALK